MATEPKPRFNGLQGRKRWERMVLTRQPIKAHRRPILARHRYEEAVALQRLIRNVVSDGD